MLVVLISIYAENNSQKKINLDYQEDPYKPFAEVMPEPVGGYEGIIKKIKYPKLAEKSGVQGKVYLLVYINEKGSVDDVKIVKGIGAGLDEAAIDALRTVSFIPAKDKGIPVKVKLTLPIIFKLN